MTTSAESVPPLEDADAFFAARAPALRFLEPAALFHLFALVNSRSLGRSSNTS